VLALVSGAAPDAAVVLRASVAVEDRALRVGDLVEGRVAPATGRLVAARLPAGVSSWALSRAGALALLRRRVPGLAVSAPAGLVSVRVRLTALARPAGAGCFVSGRAIVAGAPLLADDVTSVACRAGAPRAALRYRDGVTVVSAALPADTYLGRLAPLGKLAVAKGAALTLRSGAGPVVIERQVTALQPGRAGGRIFVRDASGNRFAVPLAQDGDK
jgi:flagella basal body P-ring formation protein FlgA